MLFCSSVSGFLTRWGVAGQNCCSPPELGGGEPGSDVTIDTRQQIRRSDSWYNPQVHQATGVIIAQTHADPNEALRRLVAQAEATGLPVDAVAADIIASRITFT